MTAPVTLALFAPKKAWEALIALGTPKLMLASATYTPNQDTLDFANDVTNEAAGTGYVSPGITLTNFVANLDAATNKVTIDADNILSTAGYSVSCRWGVVHIYTGALSTSPVIGYVDLSEGAGGNVIFTGINWDAAGIFPILVA